MGNKAKVRPVPRVRRQTVCIAFIHPGQVSAYFMESIVGTMLYDANNHGHLTGMIDEWSSANVSASRNSLTARFLDEKDADWLLWVDADMQFDPDAMHRLVEAADPKERPVMGGLCFGQNVDGLFPTLYQLVEQFGTLKTLRIKDYPRDTVYRVSATGAAFLLIHRSVLEAMRAREFNPAFPFFQETEMGGMPCGEDITFCLRATLLNFPVHVDTSVKIGHHKSVVLDENLFDAQRKDADCGTDLAG